MHGYRKGKELSERGGKNEIISKKDPVSMRINFGMENVIYNSVILKPKTKLIGKLTVPLTDPQGVEVIQMD